MRRALVVQLAVFLAVCGRVWAHGDEAAELGHHWEIPAYVNEIHLQLAAMAVAVIVIAAATLTMRHLKRKAAGR